MKRLTLRCSLCGQSHRPDRPDAYCAACGEPLEFEDASQGLIQATQGLQQNLFERYRDFLPFDYPGHRRPARPCAPQPGHRRPGRHQLKDRGEMAPDSRVVCILTAGGLQPPGPIAQLPCSARVDGEELDAHIAEVIRQGYMYAGE